MIHTRQQYLIYTIGLFLLLTTTQAQPIPDTLVQEINRRVAQGINPSISIGIMTPTGKVHYYNYGSVDPDRSATPSSTTLYEIGSVTKTFTAWLWQRHGAPILDAPIAPYCKASANPQAPTITPRQLRNHRSGLPRLSAQFAPNNWADPFNGYSKAVLEQELETVRLDTAQPWAYSNLGYATLGYVLEQHTQQTYEELLQPLLRKAGMGQTLLVHPKEAPPTLAVPTNLGIRNHAWQFTGPSRYAGGLLSNAEDLAAYLYHQVRNNALFQEARIEGANQTGLRAFGSDQWYHKDGWFVFKPDATTEIVFHNGVTGGYTAFVAYSKATQMGVVLLSNAPNIVDDIGFQLLYPAFRRNAPQRTIAYELAASVVATPQRDLVQLYQTLKAQGYPDNLLQVYWLERFQFGQGQYAISKQLSDILLQGIPDDWEVFQIQGQNLEALGDPVAACSAYQKARRLSPTNASLHEAIQRCTAASKKRNTPNHE